MVEQPAFARGDVIHRARQQLQRDFSDRASGLFGPAGQLCFEFWWNLKAHKGQRRGDGKRCQID